MINKVMWQAWCYMYIAYRCSLRLLFHCIPCIFYLSVDSLPPVVNCPTTPFTLIVEVGTTSALVNFDPPTATDNSGIIIIDSQTHAPGDTFILGQTVVTYRYRDAANNFAVPCTFIVNVVAG